MKEDVDNTYKPDKELYWNPIVLYRDSEFNDQYRTDV